MSKKVITSIVGLSLGFSLAITGCASTSATDEIDLSLKDKQSETTNDNQGGNVEQDKKDIAEQYENFMVSIYSIDKGKVSQFMEEYPVSDKEFTPEETQNLVNKASEISPLSQYVYLDDLSLDNQAMLYYTFILIGSAVEGGEKYAFNVPHEVINVNGNEASFLPSQINVTFDGEPQSTDPLAIKKSLVFVKKDGVWLFTPKPFLDEINEG